MLVKSMIALAGAALLSSAAYSQEVPSSGGCGHSGQYTVENLGGGFVRTTYPDGQYVITATLTDPSTGQTITVVVDYGFGPPSEQQINC